MKVSIDETGMMTIESETPLEAYALKKWCEENVDEPMKRVLYCMRSGTEG